MEAGTEFEVIAPATVVAEQRFTRCDLVTMVAIAHKRIQINDSSVPPRGRNQTADQKLSGFTAPKVENQKILSV